MKKLILFDIDGTLIRLVKRKYIHLHAIKKIYDVEIDNPSKINVNGITDAGILKEYLAINNIDISKDKRKFKKALVELSNHAKKVIKPEDVISIPGAATLVNRLADKGCTLGLLTGNVKGKAKAKLIHTGLHHHFKIGAFGDIFERYLLVNKAIKDARKKTGINFNKKDVFLIGDTVRDIECAQKGGVKILAVATGFESVDKLKKSKPDFVFKDFGNVEKMVKILTL